MIICQDFYHHIRPPDYSHDADRKIPMAFRLPVGWVLSGPLPSSSGLLSTCFRCKAEDVELVSQIKAWYELKSYGTYKQADAHSAADQRAHNLLESTTRHDGERYWVGMLWSDDSSSSSNSYYSELAQFKTLEKRHDKDSG